MENNIPSWILANNEMKRQDGSMDYSKEKKALRAYFLDYVNQNTVFFHTLQEKLDYLVENHFYEADFLRQYDFEDIKSLYQQAYAYKFRFKSYMAAFKFYNDYALKTNDGKRILERYEDRMVAVALYHSDGDMKKAEALLHQLMNQTFTPATPTLLNSGRARRGEMVSCFLLDVSDSLNDISRNLEFAMQLSKRGGGVSINLNNLRARGESIKGIENATKGVVGVAKMFDNAFRYADQMG